MKEYRNRVWCLTENLFTTFNINVVPREENQRSNSLVVAASTFKTQIGPRQKHEVEMVYRPSILDNLKHWQVFKDDQQIKIFMQMIEEFSNSKTNQDE